MAVTSTSSTKPSLYVEVRMKSDAGTFIRADRVRTEVHKFLSQNFVSLKLNDTVTNYQGVLSYANVIASIQVTDVSRPNHDSHVYALDDVNLDVQAYVLYPTDRDADLTIHLLPTPSRTDIEEDFAVLSTTLLPSKSLDGLWERSNLIRIFDTPIPARLLRYISRMISICNCSQFNQQILNWNRLILLYGPPGSGKTTLCRALAQKLAIRLGNLFSRGKLLEINANSLLSKWFGESSKLIARVFEQIHKTADEETVLVCVLIDEVETITGPREKSAMGSEIGDALRATNELLTALDRLRHRHNVVMFCTSNLISALDSAFLDRAEVKQLIPNPCLEATYEILRCCTNEMVQGGLIIPQDNTDVPSTTPGQTNQALATPAGVRDHYLPKYDEMRLCFWNDPTCPAMQLYEVAKASEGLSGRTLRRLPFVAFAMYTFAETCIMPEYLSALLMAAKEQLKLRPWSNSLASNSADTPGEEPVPMSLI